MGQQLLAVKVVLMNMNKNGRFPIPFLIVGLLVASVLVPAADRSLSTLATRELTPDEAIAHALNRLGFGPRPGDIERVKQMSLEKYIEQQLNPSAIADTAVQ